jgi:uncharacterized protein YrrD
LIRSIYETKKGADVFSSVGEKIGSIDRVVINPETKEVSHLVVEKGFLFNTNKVIPIEYVDLEFEDRFTLEKNAEELEVLPSYDPNTYINLDRSAYPEEEQKIDTSYWYPPIDYAWWINAGGTPGLYPKPRFVKAEDVIPHETVALKEGARVVSKDGEHIGNVEQVIVETAEDIATHIVVSEGFFLKERKLVPTTWITHVDEDQVTLSVWSDTFDNLPEYERTR